MPFWSSPPYKAFFYKHLTLSPHDLNKSSNSHYHLQYNSYNVSLENLVLDQLIIPWLIFNFLLITTVLDFVLMLLGEILSWSLMGVKEDEALPPSLHVWGDRETGTWDRKACIEKRWEGKKMVKLCRVKQYHWNMRIYLWNANVSCTQAAPST